MSCSIKLKAKAVHDAQELALGDMPCVYRVEVLEGRLRQYSPRLDSRTDTLLKLYDGLSLFGCQANVVPACRQSRLRISRGNSCSRHFFEAICCESLVNLG